MDPALSAERDSAGTGEMKRSTSVLWLLLKELKPNLDLFLAVVLLSAELMKETEGVRKIVESGEPKDMRRMLRGRMIDDSSASKLLCFPSSNIINIRSFELLDVIISSLFLRSSPLTAAGMKYTNLLRPSSLSKSSKYLS
mmetsp:Transcript_4516/g.4942  ORF Transcript_4516/g.4942 Transcript_4516/m.4942 type:complete len:140 (-) Transcript_4516:2970-3389(-)